jgi:hypothetical protein
MNKYTLVILFALVGIVFSVGCTSSVPVPTTDQTPHTIPSTNACTAVGALSTHIRPHNGAVVAWGEADSPHDNITNVAALSAGYGDSLILKDDGTVVRLDNSGNYTTIANLTNITAISGGHLILKDDGTVVSLIPNDAAPANLTNVKAIAAGSAHNLALKADGTVVAWGNNESGQCNVPANLTNVTAVAAWHFHSVALKEDGTVVLWGYSGPALDLAPDGFTNVTAIAAGEGHTIGLKTDGTLVGTGEIVRPIGLGPREPPPIPPIPDWVVGCKVLKIAAGPHHCVAVVDTCESPTTPSPANKSTCTHKQGESQ